MTGIYIHIPFCRSRCIYCGFYSTTSLDLRQRYTDALVKEMALRRAGTEVKTIYIGGGTPSQLTISQLQQIIEALYIYNKVSPEAEVTIEVNPDDVTEEFAHALSKLPVNRISMGAQTFSDERLKYLKRRHTASQVAEAIDRLRAVGIQNISVDLMYGFPGETFNDWEYDIDKALALEIEHLSAYCLMIEEGTPLYQLTSHNSKLTIDEELERSMYERLMNRLEPAGYEHYEISNFAKPGYRSRHNSSYWDNTPYIGIGAAAHSYDGNSRSWNVADIHQYIVGMENGNRLFEFEVLDKDTRYNDMVTVALRTREGLNLTKLSKEHRDYCIKNARRFVNDGLLQINNSFLKLTRRGLFVSDMVMSELMMV